MVTVTFRALPAESTAVAPGSLYVVPCWTVMLACPLRTMLGPGGRDGLGAWVVVEGAAAEAPDGQCQIACQLAAIHFEVAPLTGSKRHAWPCSLCAVLLGRAVVLVATGVVGCLVVVAGGAEVGPCVLAGAVVGSTVGIRGGPVEVACVVLGPAVPGSSAVMLGGAAAKPGEAIPGCTAGAGTGADAAGSSVEVVGANEVVSGSVVGGAVVDSSLVVYGAADVDSGYVVGGAVLGSPLVVLGAAGVDSGLVVGGAVVGSLVVVLGGAVAGCSVEKLGDAVEGTPEVELGASDEASPVEGPGAADVVP